jgi:(1->4)-alpha-D-glucan 1-alpha-D-glucosylmutase
MSRAITATYRLQLSKEFPLARARALVPYFQELGVSHLYLSPVLAARPGSLHGYDVVDPTRVNPELGSDYELRALADALHAHRMGIVLDIVPNHMAASEHNPYWDDVLQRGRGSRYVGWFDIDWEAPHTEGRIVLPVLGDDLDHVLARGEIRLRIRDSGSRIAYGDQTFPLDPATLPKEVQLAQFDPAGRPAAEEWASGKGGRQRLRALLEAQQYEMTHWRRVERINYRRFFDINDLVAIRMESDEVFDATHRLILDWVRNGVIDGVRVDHVDGLRLPSWYLAKLRKEVDAAKPPGVPERVAIFVEKILSGDETLPQDWPVDGSTGYDFLNDVEELFLDPAGFTAIEASYRALRRNPSLTFRAIAQEGKRRPDVMRVARIAHGWRPKTPLDDLAAAVVELVVHLDVYRTYLGAGGVSSSADRHALRAAFRAARNAGAAGKTALTVLEDAFFAPPKPTDRLRNSLVTRFQQLSGPATAKGVEDTALYVYLPLVSRNEVGGEPERPLRAAHERMHARNAARARDWPGTLLATNTHDTKRSADLRARLDVLTAVPLEWSRHVARWRRLNKTKKRTVRGRPAPATNSEYLYYQTLLGLWPSPRPGRRVDDLPDREFIARSAERLTAYMIKAAREAKAQTSWTETDTEYERALDAFVRETLAPDDDAPLLGDLARMTALTAEDGFRFSLARLLLQCTAPGTPDIYQGDEIWNFTLVDPDNRRPVDFEQRARLLREVVQGGVLRAALGGGLSDGRVKLALLARLLRFRREHPELLSRGDYQPLTVRNCFAFARRHLDRTFIAIGRTRVPDKGIGKKATEAAETVAWPPELAGPWTSALTGRAIELARAGTRFDVRASDLIAPDQPCELWERSSG